MVASLARAEAADGGLEPPSPPAPPPSTARDRLNGTWGLGFLGGAPVFRAIPATDAQGQVIDTTTVPVVGVRWWSPWRSRLGIDVGLGAGLTSTSASGQVVSPFSGELLVHLGLPIVMASTTNAIAFVAPEGRFGLSLFDQDGPGGAMVSATSLNFGARAGLEVFFTFIGLPNLSLEASLGAWAVVNSRAVTFSGQERFGRSISPESTAQVGFRTSFAANPWETITSSIVVRYYF